MSRGLPNKQKNLLDKAKESALLAVDIYNKPQTSFRVWWFIVLMTIARTSLLHAVFEKSNKSYFYKDKNRFIKIDDEKKSRELEKCLEEYFPNKNPIKSNILFFVWLRNKIEHRFMPSIDDNVIGECQALIINFENFLIRNFWEKNALIDKLFIPLQISHYKRTIPIKKDEKRVLDFINKYRNWLDINISNSNEYSYKMYLIPKMGNHKNSSDVAIEFIKLDSNNPAEMKKYEDFVIGIKKKALPVGSSVIISKDPDAIKINPQFNEKEINNSYPLSYREVRKQITKKYGKEFYTYEVPDLIKKHQKNIELAYWMPKSLRNPEKWYNYIYSNKIINIIWTELNKKRNEKLSIQ